MRISFHGTYWLVSRTVELFTYGMELGTVIPSAALSPPKEGKGRAFLPVGGGSQEGIARLSLDWAKLNTRSAVTLVNLP